MNKEKEMRYMNKEKEMKYMNSNTKITVSLIKADVGGFPGHASVHPDLKEVAKRELEIEKKEYERKLTD